MSERTMKRRRFLKSVASGIAFSQLPLTKLAAANPMANGKKLRFLCLYNSLGIPYPTRDEFFVSESEGALSNLKPILSPFSDFKENIVVVTGCDLKTALSQDVGGHPAGVAHGLTGTLMKDASNRANIRSNGPSIDVAIGEGLGAGTPYPHLQLNVGDVRGNSKMCASFSMNGQQNPRIIGPKAIYKNLFQGFAPEGEDKGFDPSLSVLKYTADSLNSLKERLRGKSHKEAMLAFEESVAGVRDQIKAIENVQCEKVASPDSGDLRTDLRQTLSLVRNIFACDLTRSVYLDVGGTSSRIRHTWMSDVLRGGDANREHHSFSHDRTDTAFENMCKIREEYAKFYARFFKELQETPDGGGDSVFDNTVVLWFTETSQAARHTLTDMPCVLIAGKNTGIKQGGFHINGDGRPINDLHAALMQTFGLSDGTFGDKKFNSRPLEIFQS